MSTEDRKHRHKTAETPPEEERAIPANADEGTSETGGAGPDANGAEPGPEQEDLNTKFLRLAADFQNYRRRIEKEKSDLYAFANERLITELLAVADNFERALGSDSRDKALRDGMELVFKQFGEVLKRHGLEEMEALGSPFDPNFHHAVLMEPTGDSESGHVVEVLQKGYLLNKKVIRHAMVKVAE